MLSGMKAIIWGYGNYGQEILRQLQMSSINLAAVIDRRSERIGTDAGRLAGLPNDIGIEVRSPQQIFAELPDLNADICIICTNSSVDSIFEPAISAMQAGMNCVTLAEEMLYPWNTSIQKSKELDEVAKKFGVTITGCGASDILMACNAALLAASTNQPKRIISEICYNVSGNPRLEAAHGVGLTIEQFEKHIAEPSPTDHFSRPVIEWICSVIGREIAEFEYEILPMQNENVALRTDPAEAQKCIGQVSIARALTREGLTVECRCKGAAGETVAEHYRWIIEGSPPIDVTLNNPNHLSMTAACLISRVGQVIEAPSGLVTTECLPLKPFFLQDIG